MSKKILTAIVFIISFTNVQSQIISDAFLKYFEVTQVQKYVTCKWKTGIDFTCSEVSLYYGKDSNNMEAIYQYPGVCGSRIEEKEYEYLHPIPVEDEVYYQLRLGAYGNSRIKIVNKNKTTDAIIYPNPIVDYFNVNLFNYKGTYSLRIFTVGGELVKQFKKVKNKKQLYLPDRFLRGIYYYSILLNNNETIQGKLVKI